MAKANPSIDEGYRNLPRNTIERLENNAEYMKQTINEKVDTLIESINAERGILLNQIGNELAKAKESFKKHEDKKAARMRTKKKLAEDLVGDEELLTTLSHDIDEELNKVEDLPDFKIEWNTNFTKICEDAGEIGELKTNRQSRFDSIDTPLWSTLNRGKADNEIGEPKAIAIDPETSNIYVGDASAGKILVMDKTGKYLHALTFKKPSSIHSMAICQIFIYCRSNGFWHNTIFQLHKNTGALLNQYNSAVPIDSFTAVPKQVFFCDIDTLATLTPNLTDCKYIKDLTSDSKTKNFEFRNVKCVSEELVTLIKTTNTEHSIQVFDKKGVFLRVIAEKIEIPVRNSCMDVLMCIDEYWTIYISIDGDNLVNLYNNDGKFVSSLKQGNEKSGIYQPRDIALDRDGNLIVCSNRKQDILQAY